jgi:gamma-glutamylaminecyclotransferase
VKKVMVFVYGTLKKDFYFHDEYLGDGKSDFKGLATTTDEFSLYIDGMPHMIKEKSPNGVKGELYMVDEKVLNSLDELEGHPVVYKREIIDVILEDGTKGLAWAYLRPKQFKGRQFAWREDEFL